jgi:hypothetical protein
LNLLQTVQAEVSHTVTIEPRLVAASALPSGDHAKLRKTP